MWYAPIVVHVLMIAIARRAWRRRGLEWSPFELAECVVFPFLLLLAWPLVASLLPLPWKQMNEIALGTIVYLPPLLIFWFWFFWSGSGESEVSQRHAVLDALGRWC